MKLLVLLVVCLFGIHSAFATDQIFITKSFDLDKVIFDGKWTFYTEWKKSSWNPLTYDNGTTIIDLRTAHQGNFIYVFVDDVKTTQWSSGKDKATICFDTNDSKNTVADASDYCFQTVLSGTEPITLQGDSTSPGSFKTIPNPDGFIGVASISDANDRYTDVPHPGYEFRIPTDTIGRSADYGFYVSVYHSQSNKTYSWPQDISTSASEIPSPNKWGELISPDKSLPEFPVPAITLLGSIIVVIYFSRNVIFKRFA